MHHLWSVLRAYFSGEVLSRSLTGLCSIVLVVLLGVLLRSLFRRGSSWLEARQERLARVFRFKGVQLVGSAEVLSIAQGALRLVRGLCLLLLVYVMMGVLFSLFPSTSAVASFLRDRLVSTLKGGWNGFVAYIPNLISIVVTVVIVRYAIRLIRFVMNAVAKREMSLPGFHPDWAGTTYQLARFLLIMLGIVSVAPYLPGAASPAFRGISLFAGVLVSLGSGGAMSSVVSGIFLTYTDAFRLGDTVHINDHFGTVIERTLLVTRVRTPKNEEITVPNSAVLSGQVVNYSRAARRNELVVHASVTLGYDVPWRQAAELLTEAALKTAHILREPGPFVLQTALDGSWVAYQINAYTDDSSQLPRLYSDLYGNIQDTFNQAGVELMTCQIHALRDGNPSTIPLSYRPENYQAPGFRLLRL